MPTKPVVVFEIATAAVYTSGPATGFPTKVVVPSILEGNIPGTGVAGEHLNHSLNITGDWITNWVFLGTFAADEDAHLVETDADGLISSTRLNVGGSTLGGNVPSAAIGGNVAGDAPSLSVTFGAGPNRALFVAQSSSTSSASAAFFQNVDSSGGVVEILSAATNTGTALDVTGNSNGGTAVDVTAGTGRGVVVTTSDGEPAPLRLLGRDLPSALALGDVWVEDATNFERLRVSHSGAAQTVWTTTLGFARDYGETLAATSTSAGGGLTARVTIVIPASAGLLSTATVHLRAVAELGSDANGSTTEMGIRDDTAGVDIRIDTVRMFNATSAADEREHVIEADYTIPVSGARTFILGWRSDGVDTAHIRNATLEITGQYD